ncbi:MULTISPECIES: 2-hydroxymuconate tautomerase [Rummeliibacillus]|jgi:4-oxalocrotonate tautomerase|uniref:2-hydroxymuconate tautomerase n=1 Tax=Rummeliibacillus TaxID=648802 RepID=UPI0011B81047|nr:MULTISPECIES: 2-hydroxymuconate tautomerase [Rummeliibacillus]MBO2535549.1 4-oxalocrotonate tautomerase [Rummeliibacillus suwonensis]
MPVVTIKLIEGRTDEQKHNLVEKVTEAISETVNAPKENVTIIIEEMKKEHYAVGGVRKSEQ